jgi:uncharacterized membrane protein
METNQIPNPPQANIPGSPPKPQGTGNNTGMAILAYLGILIIVPFLTEAKNDPFVKFHIKQGLVLIISEFVAIFLFAIPFFGWIVAPFIWLFNLIMIIVGIINAASGKQTELPLIGSFGRNFNF